jgi:Protein of unknown function (DUF1572)
MNQTSANNHSIGHAYIAACRRRFAACVERIKHCLVQLDDSQVWWRPNAAQNSIANIVLHLCGNVRQWIIAGVAGAADTRNRPQEFAERGPIAKDELVRRLDEVAAEVDHVLAGVTDDRLLKIRRIQGFEETVLSAIFETLTHFNGHTQEIVYITRLKLGDAYQFSWVPITAEQGAPV